MAGHNLNSAQLTAVNTLRGPLLVLAGAGTGKTRVVTCRIAELIKHGTRPARILAVTFTNKAAAEMHERAMALLGRQPKERPEISTFHSLCVRILRRHAPRLGYPAKFAIYDRSDQESVARTALREIKVGEEALRPGDLVNFISRWKMRSLTPEAATTEARADKEHLASMAYRRYQRALRLAGAVDFDDLLLCTEELFARFADVRQAEASRFSHLLVDEYQDTNASQYQIVKALAGGHRNLCVVGDDDQSIYGWRGAEVQHILGFKKDWPEATVIRLEDNYRSTEAILSLANRLIKHNRHRHDKVLRAARAGGQQPRILQSQDEADEARAVVSEIRGQLGGNIAQPRDFAILFRTNEQPRVFEMELRRQQVPYVLVGGMSFYDRKEVRDVLAYLKLLVSPSDEVSLRRIINTPARGIGPRAVEALTAVAVSRRKPLVDILKVAGETESIAPPTVEAIGRFLQTLDVYRKRLANESLVDVVNGLVRQIDYRGEIHRLYRDPQNQEARWAAVEEVINSLGTYEQRTRKPTLGGFLDEIMLGDRDTDQKKEQQLARNAVALMTLHSAKGLEFPQVYLVGMEEGLLPHRRSVEAEGSAIDEERRLCYVGITRARDRLTISLALARNKWGKLKPTVPSRFLYEITGQAKRAGDKPRPRPSKPKSAVTARSSRPHHVSSKPAPRNPKRTPRG